MTPEEEKHLHDMLPDLPADFEDWMMDNFDGWHIIFYSRPDRDIYLECCHCGARSRETLRKDDPILPAWGNKELPKKGDQAECPYCGCAAKMMPRKNRKKPIITEGDFWIGQSLIDGGYVLRFFRAKLLAFPDEEYAYEEIDRNEKMRLWFPKGMRKKVYKEFKHYYIVQETDHSNHWIGYWDTNYCFNTMGYSSSSPEKGIIYPGTFEEMKGTVMQYSCTEEALEDFNVTIADWQQAYAKDKWIEMLYKLGLHEIIRQKIWGYHFPKCNHRAKNPYDYLKIKKNRLKYLCDLPWTQQMDAWKIFRAERELGESWGEEVGDLIKAKITEEDMKYFLSFMTMTKLMNYLRKCKRKDSKRDIHDIYLRYRDYLTMKENTQYDMTDSIVLYPKDLNDSHDKATIESTQKEADARKSYVNKTFGRIQRRFKGANEIYGYEKGAFLIRPAKTAGEIVDEGRILHHCVGGDSYLKAHADRQSIICFMRTKKYPDVPYITVEINPDGSIEQWYGIHDSKPDQKKIDRWLKAYTKNLDRKALAEEAHKVRKSVKKAV